MKIWAGWTLNHRNPSSAPMISAHSSARFGWAGVLSSAMSMYATKAIATVPARQPVEAVGDVHAVGGGDDRERREEPTYSHGSIGTAPYERDRDGRDPVRLLDLAGRDERDDGQPDELLAGLDPLPGPRVEVVVEGAERTDAGQRRQRRERRGVGLLQEEVDAEDDHDDEQAAHRRRALLDEVALGPFLADPLAEPDRLQQPDVGRHQDHDQREGEQQALDELDGQSPPSRPARDRRPSTTVEPDAARGLDEDHVAVAQPRPERVERLLGVRHDVDARAGRDRLPRAPRRCRRPRIRRRPAARRSPPPPRRPRGGRVVRVAELEHLAEDRDPTARQAGQELERRAIEPGEAL